jgi:hypothetical protein
VPPKSPSEPAEEGVARRPHVTRKVVLGALAAVALVVLGTYGFSRLPARTSSATVTVRITSGAADPMLAAAPLDPAALNLDAETARSFSTAIKAAALLKPPPSTAALLIQRGHQLMRDVTVTTDFARGTVSITAHDRNSQQAALTADAFARALLAVRRAQSVILVNAQLKSLAGEVRVAPAGVRNRLKRTIASLRGLLRQEAQQTEVRLSSTSGSPAVLNAWIALALSLLICVALFLGLRRGGGTRARGPETSPVTDEETNAHRGVDEIVSSRS